MNARKCLSVARLAALAGVSGLAVAVPAAAQNALDHNTQVGSGGVNQARPDFAQEVRFRNAIVTGNAPGGMSFRGNAGYRAPGEFTGNLGSNDLFSFRRDTVTSGLGGMGLRGTDALQYQFAATTGNAPPAGFDPYRTVSRAGTGATASMLESPDTLRGAAAADTPYRTQPLLPDGRSTDSISAIRSPAAYMATRDLRPAYVASGYDVQGRPKTVSVSPLRGIAFDEMVMSDPSTRDAAATGVPRETAKPVEPGTDRAAPASHPGQDNPVQATSTSAKPVDPHPAEARVDQRLDTSQSTLSPYDEVVARMRKGEQAKADEAAGARQGEKAASGPTGTTGAGAPSESLAAWDQHLKELRDSMREQGRGARRTTPGRGPIGPAGTSGAPGPTGASGDTGAQPGDAPADMRPSPAAGATGDSGAKAQANAGNGLGSDTVRILRSTREEVRRLAPPGFDAYAQAMKVAQDHLAGGRFFDAEERFTSALSTRPRDPMAAAGRVNAEIGAGMFLSAAVNLRSLLMDHPEMTGVRYAPDLMQRADRTPVLMARLNELVDAKDEKSRDAALLLAFVGYQTGDAGSVRKGLDTLTQGIETARPEEGRLLEVLKAVWQDGGAAPSAPAPAHAPAAPTPAPATTGAPR